VIQVAYSSGDVAPNDTIPDRVNMVKDHPAVLMWEVGSQWNWNGLNVGLNLTAARELVAEAVSLVKQLDPWHPVVSSYGELPSNETVKFLDKVDVWSISSYRTSFVDLFRDWQALTEKPMYLGDYGADAWDSRTSQPNFSAQASAIRDLTQIIVANSAVGNPPYGVCSGGCIFEFADEWWRASNQSVDEHDSVSEPRGQCGPVLDPMFKEHCGPFPDKIFNTEWNGLCDIDRNKRPAFYAYANSTVPTGPAVPDYEPRSWVLFAVGLLGVTAYCLYWRAQVEARVAAKETQACHASSANLF